MDRTSRRALLAGVLGVVALGAVAAGVPVATGGPDATTGGPGGGSGGPGPGAGTAGIPVGDPLPGGGGSTVVAALLVLVVGAAVLWAVLDAGPARVAVPLLAATALAGLFALLASGSGALPAGGLDAGLPVAGGGAAGGDGGATAVPTSLLVAATAVALALPAALWVLTRSGDPPPDEEGGGPTTDAEARAAVARAAGRAADRIESREGVLENEVYRCWREMTRPLPAGPGTTPGEFAAAAVERGVDPDHARELTALFERVRYGEHAPTDDDERRAVACLRRVEAAYAADGDDGGAAGDGRSDGATTDDGRSDGGDPTEGDGR